MKLKNLFLITVIAFTALSCSKDDGKDTNGAPSINPDQIFNVPETKVPGDNLGKVQASDPDGDPLTYSISGNAGPFIIGESNGELGLAEGQSLDYDTTNTYTLTISVTDNTDTATETITINVTNVNQAPTITEGQAFSVKEDIDDAFEIGTVEANDEDSDPITFSIADEISPFEITENGILSLIPNKTLDYETQTEYTVTIEVGDGTDTVQETITIVVENVPDAPYALDKTSFVLEFKTTMANQEIGVGTDFFNDGYDYIIDWGDGTPVEHITDSTEPTHIYADEGTHTVAINGDFPRVTFNDRPWDENVTGILNWGTIEWETFEDAFFGCTQLENYVATDTPNLTNVTDMSGMFQGAESFNGDLNNWDVSTITSMGNMFSGASSFNGNIGNWIVQEVTNMSYMFDGASSFNQDISGWDVSKVETMAVMFNGASDFDQNLGNWPIVSLGLGATMWKMFDNTNLSQENYSNTLIGWQTQDNTPTGITLGAAGLEYCGSEAVEARALLVDENDGYGWTINGDSKCQT